MSSSEERGPGPSLDVPEDAPAPNRPPPGQTRAQLPLSTDLGRRVPDWAPIAAVLLLVVLGVAGLMMRL